MYSNINLYHNVGVNESDKLSLIVHKNEVNKLAIKNQNIAYFPFFYRKFVLLINYFPMFNVVYLVGQ